MWSYRRAGPSKSGRTSAPRFPHRSRRNYLILRMKFRAIGAVPFPGSNSCGRLSLIPTVGARCEHAP
ncbi:hypothetical protein ABH999_006575 [Bradyrhizobium yuanmingense]